MKLSRFTRISLSALLLSGLCAPAVIVPMVQAPATAQQTQSKRAVSVLYFEYKEGSWSNAKEISDSVAGELIGPYKVIDNSQLGQKSWSYANVSGAIDAGRKLGVDVIVVGRVNRYGYKKSGSGSLGGLTGGSKKAVVQLQAKIIEVSSGAILAQVESEGKASSGSGSISLGGIRVGSGNDDRDERLDNAAAKAVEELAAKIQNEV